MDWLRTSLGDSPLEGQVDDSARRVDRWRVQRGAQDGHLPGRIARLAEVRPQGYSIAATRGFAQRCRRSAIGDRMMVVKPAASISRCTSPTDQQQTGQAGASSTTSTPSSLRWPMMAGAVSCINLLRLQDIAHDGVVAWRRLLMMPVCACW